jgi:hypothetical protein
MVMTERPRSTKPVQEQELVQGQEPVPVQEQEQEQEQELVQGREPVPVPVPVPVRELAQGLAQEPELVQEEVLVEPVHRVQET